MKKIQTSAKKMGLAQAPFIIVFAGIIYNQIGYQIPTPEFVVFIVVVVLMFVITDLIVAPYYSVTIDNKSLTGRNLYSGFGIFFPITMKKSNAAVLPSGLDPFFIRIIDKSTNQKITIPRPFWSDDYDGIESLLEELK